jgi:hypothetical protein
MDAVMTLATAVLGLPHHRPQAQCFHLLGRLQSPQRVGEVIHVPSQDTTHNASAHHHTLQPAAVRLEVGSIWLSSHSRGQLCCSLNPQNQAAQTATTTLLAADTACIGSWWAHTSAKG